MKVLFRLFGRVFRLQDGLETLRFSLLLTAVFAAAAGGSAARWVPGSEIFWHVALVGALLGWLARRLRMGYLLVGFGMVGVGYVSWHVTHLGGSVLAALVALVSREQELALLWWREIVGRLASLALDFGRWTLGWMDGELRAGPQVTLFWMAWLLWMGAVAAGWGVARRRYPWGSLAPLGGLLALSTYLGDTEITPVLLFMGVAVGLVPVTMLRAEEESWDRREVWYSEEFRVDAGAVALAAMAVFVLVGAAMPNVRVREAARWVWDHLRGTQEAVSEVLERTFPAARPAVSGPEEEAWRTGLEGILPNEHLLGGSPDLGREVVMYVRVDAPPPLPYEYEIDEDVPRLVTYWRLNVYDRYTGAGWARSVIQAYSWAPYDPLGPSDRPGRSPLRQEFERVGEVGSLLAAAADPLSFDIPVTVYRWGEDGEVVAVESNARRYRVVSLIPQVNEQALRELGEVEYPPAIAERYLALPESLPERVRELAQEVVAGQQTAYDRALALESYLRTFPYDLDVPMPPEGRDVVDFFLFDLQRGYCDYVASAMVVMARAVGLPARLAVGYAMGHYDFDQGVYVVTQGDAHAWPEVYFPSYGWIPFEPTGGLSPLPREEQRAISLPPLGRPERSFWVRLRVGLWRFWHRLGGWTTVMVALGGGVLIGWVRYRMGRPKGPGRVIWAYALCRWVAGRLGVPLSPVQTPEEFAALSARVVGQRVPRVRWLKGWLGRRSARWVKAVEIVARLYQRVAYAPVLPSEGMMRWGERVAWWAMVEAVWVWLGSKGMTL